MGQIETPRYYLSCTGGSTVPMFYLKDKVTGQLTYFDECTGVGMFGGYCYVKSDDETRIRSGSFEPNNKFPQILIDELEHIEEHGEMRKPGDMNE